MASAAKGRRHATAPSGGPRPGNPALQRHGRERAQDVQNRIADGITRFAGSMGFVYIHAAVFAAWMLLLEHKPWPTLTLVVSLEAIFLSTFVMISQNRADARRQVLADQQWEFVKTEERQNEELLQLSNQILELTEAIHQFTEHVADTNRLPQPAGDGDDAEAATLTPAGSG
ncbi:MAG TPA: DUF1003 domain-containing protein [Thermoleophilia bacterium]|nr:DUF1003 domain-containing protein [Thermoleophilia bacterium]